MFNDDWMRERGFLEEEHKTAIDLIDSHKDLPLITLGSEELVSHAVSKMREFNISQIPVTKDGDFVGVVDEKSLINHIIDCPEDRDIPVSKIMGESLPIVGKGKTVNELSKIICKDCPAVLVDLENGKHQILTRHDLIAAI